MTVNQGLKAFVREQGGVTLHSARGDLAGGLSKEELGESSESLQPAPE